MKISFEEAKRNYLNRFTMEHIPSWAKKNRPDGTYYAPQYKTDREWYEKTTFPPDNPVHPSDCWSQRQSWPVGLVLGAPFTVEMFKRWLNDPFGHCSICGQTPCESPGQCAQDANRDAQ